MKTASRIINLGWFFGLFYFQLFLTSTLLLKRIKTFFQIRAAMPVLALAVAALALGALLAVWLLRKTQDDRIHNVLDLFSIILYAAAVIGVNIRQPAPVFLLWVVLCAGTMGYSMAQVNAAASNALRLDRFAGRIIALSVMVCCALLSLAAWRRLERLFLIGGLLLLIYFFCRPPTQQLSFRNRKLRSDLTVVDTKRTILHYLSMVAILGLRCGASVCLTVPIFNIENLLHGFCNVAVFCGVGAVAAGVLWDRLNRYLPMIAFCSICFSLVNDIMFGVVTASRIGMAASNLTSGGIFLYFACAAVNFPHAERPPEVINQAAITFFAAMAVSIAGFSQCILLPDGRTIVLTLSALSVVLILIQLFFDSIYQSHETPAVAFEVRLDAYKLQYGLTARETEVASLVLTSEKSLKSIAAELFISPSTLEKHMTSIYEKTHVKNRSELTHNFFAEERGEAQLKA